MTAAESAASRQWAVPVRTTPRNVRSVSPPFSTLYGRALSHACTAFGVRRRAISRRSAAVNGLAGGSAGSARGSGSGFEVGNELRRRPVIAAVRRHQPAFGVDDGGAEIMSDVDRAARIALHVDAELGREARRVLRLRRDERPYRWIRMHLLRMRFQYRWCVELGIERHRQQPDVGESRRALERLLNGRE